MLAFARFCVYEGDGKFLVEHNNMTLKKGFGHYPGFHYGGAGFNGMNIFPFDHANERTAWTVLAGAAVGSLEKYDKSTEEDERLLRDDNLSHSER